MDQSDIYKAELVPTNPQQAIELAEVDLNFLAGLCMYDKMQFLFPKMFLVIWEFLKIEVMKNRHFPQLALGIPRGFAKTTLMKLWIVFCVLFTRKSFLLVVSYNEDHAINIVKDACDMLSSPNIIALFGDWRTNLERDKQTIKIFNFRARKIIIAGIGAKGSIRGLNVGNDRPDLMIFEDYQSKKESENEALSEELYKEMLGTIMKACSPFGCMYIYVANMYPTPGSILKKLKANKDWLSFIVGAILADGSSLWEELQPVKQLLEEYMKDLRAGHPEVFLAEKLNDEHAGIKAGIDITKIPRFPYDEHELPQGRALIIDPALDNPNSDYNGIGLVGIYDGKPCLEEVKLEKFSPLGLIKAALLMGFRTGARLIAVENKAYQASLLFWFNEVCEQNGIEGFQFMPLNTGTSSKNGKIRDFLTELTKKEVYIKDSVRPYLINEIIKWNPLKTKNQDTCLDLGCFSKKVFEQYGHMMTMPYEATVQELMSNISVRSEAENCMF